MKKKLKVVSILMALLTLISAVPVSASENTGYLALNIGESVTLSASQDAVIESSNEAVVRVDEETKAIIAVAPGYSNVSIVDADSTDYIRVKVFSAELTLNTTDATIYHGGTSTNSIQLRAKKWLGAASHITWASSDKSVATVNETGKVVARGEGEAMITAISNGLTGVCLIHVKETSVSPDVDHVRLTSKGVGSTCAIPVTIVGSSNKITWTSSDTSIVAVGKKGLTAKKPGNAVVSAIANGVKADIDVEVVAESISIKDKSVTLYKGDLDSVTLTASYDGKALTAATTPSLADVVWSSSNEEVATVSNGVVTAVYEGEGRGVADITATYNGKSESCRVYVYKASTTLNMSDINIGIKDISGKASTFTLIGNTVGRVNKITWKSSDAKVASVKNGVVTAKAPGSAVISATANGQVAYCNVNVVGASLTVTPATVVIPDLNGTFQLNASATGIVNGIFYTSSNSQIASVSSDGLITGHKAGTAKITVTSNNGLKSVVSVTVKEVSTKLDKTSATAYLNCGKASAVTLKCTAVGPTKAVAWTSSNEEVATVSNKGVVTPVAPGTCEITATANDKSATCSLTVAEPTLSLSESAATLTVDNKKHELKLIATVAGPSSSVTWSSTNTKVASVKNGVVTAKGAGSATITAKANGVESTCVITVEDTSEDIETTTTLDKSEILLNTTKMKSATLTATAIGATNAVTWVSSNPAVATVSNKGVVTAKSEGTTTITATANGVAASCNVVVTVNTVQLDHTTLMLNTSGTATRDTIIGTVNGIIGDNAPVWASSNTKVATVSNGLVRAVGKGSANITYTCNGVVATCKVTVIDNTITLDKKFLDLDFNNARANKGTLKAKIAGVNKTVTWESSNPNVATVENGVVTAVDEGAAIITATANGIKATCDVNVVNSNHQHNFELVNETASTCTVAGIKEYQCISCKDTYTEDADFAAHEWGEWIETKTPSTTEEGTKERHCINCDAVETDSIPKSDHEHSFGEATVIVAATCEAPGTNAETCTAENCDYTRLITTPALGHDMQMLRTVAPTCTENGYDEYKCSRCTNTEQRNEVAALGHNYEGAEVVIDTPATCETDGEQSKHCQNPGCTQRSDIETIPATGHDYSIEVETVAPTCEESGYTTMKCSHEGCESTTRTNEVAALGHDWDTEWTVEKAATCTMVGSKYHACKNPGCTAKNDVTEIPALGHKYDGEENIVSSATCVSNGLKTIKCSNESCDSFTTLTITALGHEWSEEWIVKVPATCVTSGSRIHACTRSGCSAESEAETIAALGHDYTGEEEILLNATCEANGTKLVSCTACESKTNVVIPALGHDWAEEWTESKTPTCTEVGEKYKACTRENCNGKNDVTEIPALGHDFTGESRVSKAPTCTEEGVRTIDCSRCTETNDEAIAALGHEWATEFTEDVAPTCTEKGSKSKHCTREGCSDVTEITEIAELGHNYVEKTEDNSGVANGYKYSECSRCSDRIDEMYLVIVKDRSGATVSEEYVSKTGQVNVSIPELGEGDEFDGWKVNGIDYTDNESYTVENPDHAYVIQSRMHTNTLTITANGWEGTYDGNSHSITISSNEDDTAFTYSDAENGTYSETAPSFTDAGSYTIYWKAKKTKFATATGSVEINITKATGTGTVSMLSWTYGEEKNTPIVTSETNGTDGVVYEYKEYGAEDSTYTSEVPTNAGNYTVKATFAESTNYKSFYAVNSFKIEPAEEPSLSLSNLTLTSCKKAPVSFTFETDMEAIVNCEETDVAAVETSGNTVTVTPITEGVARVSVSALANANYKNAATQTCTITFLGACVPGEGKDGKCKYCGGDVTGIFDEAGNMICGFREENGKVITTLNDVNVAEGSDTNGIKAQLGDVIIKKIILPAGVTAIGDYMFAGCDELTEITTLGTVNSIGAHAFDGCTKLTTVDIPNGPTVVGEYAFYNCANLKELVLSANNDGYTTLGTSAFENCTMIQSVKCLGKVKYIPVNAFKNCANLEEFVMPNIENVAYQLMSGNGIGGPYDGGVMLTDAPIQSGINESAFENCGKLKAIAIPDAYDTIGERAFKDCTSLETMPVSTAKTIANEAFAGSGIKSVTIPDFVTTIGTSAFENCKDLTSVTIPANCKRVNANAFAGCTSLNSVTCTSQYWYKTSVKSANQFLVATMAAPEKAAAVFVNATYALIRQNNKATN